MRRDVLATVLPKGGPETGDGSTATAYVGGDQPAHATIGGAAGLVGLTGVGLGVAMLPRRRARHGG